MLKKIENIINSDSSQDKFFSLEFFLRVLSFVYLKIMQIRAFCYKSNFLTSKKLPCRVISIGNITVGGTGKTPMVIYLATFLKKAGYKVVIISRGYGGTFEKKGGIVSDGKKLFMNSDESGDEPFMIAKSLNFPVIIGKDRFKAGMIAVNRFQPDLILLDDAFQHQRLKRDLDIVLLDCQKPFGNRCLLPRGILREPPESLKRSDIIIMTRCQKECSKYYNYDQLNEMKKLTDSAPVFQAIHIPYVFKIIKKNSIDTSLPIVDIKQLFIKQKIVAFSGIAHNKGFYETVRDLLPDHLEFIEFKDHHKYTKKDIQLIIQTIYNTGADLVVTTQKDYMRLLSGILWPVDFVVLGVKISFKNCGEDFYSTIYRKLW